MKVILLKDVPKIGKKDEVKDVSQGHANNFLIPRGLARVATSGDVQALANRLKEQEVHKKVAKELVHETIKSLDGKNIVIKEKANDKNHLFSKVHKEEVVKAIKDELGSTIDKDWITMEDDPIKEIGEHLILIKAEGSKAKLKLVIEKD